MRIIRGLASFLSGAKKDAVIDVDNQTVYPLIFTIREEKGTLFIAVRSGAAEDNVSRPGDQPAGIVVRP